MSCSNVAVARQPIPLEAPDPMTVNHKKSKLAIAIQSSIVGLSLSNAVNAATIKVTAGGDNQLSNCVLREAITSINLGADSGGCEHSGDWGDNDTIEFASNVAGSTIDLLNGQMFIAKDVHIDGGIDGITIDAASQSRIFNINDSNVTFNDLTLTNGSTDNFNTYFGGAILAQDSDLNISRSIITNNSAARYGGAIMLRRGSLEINETDISSNSASQGGGIYVTGTSLPLSDSSVVITNSTFSSNTAPNGAGAISTYYNINLSVTDSMFYDNNAINSPAGYLSNGGAIRASASKVSIVDSILSGNSADDNGGAVYAGSKVYEYNSLTISGSTITTNNANYGDGGGIDARGVNLSINNSSISNNSGVFGGALFSSDNSVLINESQLSNNSITKFGGATQFSNSLVNIQYSSMENNHAEIGGAIDVTGGSLTLYASLLANNSASQRGGGIDSTSTIEIINSTLSNNLAADKGGGLYSSLNATANIQNSTFSKNSAMTNGGGGIFISPYASLHQVTNSIIVNSLSGLDCVEPNLGGLVMSDPESIIGQSDCDTDAREIDPGLQPLQDNGGFTLTHALNINSPARNTGDNISCKATDQRGEPRNDGACDVGAFEFHDGDEVETDDTNFIVIPLTNGKAVIIPN